MEQIYQGAPGVAAYENDDGFSQIELLIGDIPPNGTPVDLPVAASSDFPLFAVVGLDANGVLAWGKTSATAVKPIGVLMVPVVTGAGQTTTARVHRSGHFNGNALRWHADYDTNTKKAAAFEGSPSPTAILIGFNPYDPTFTA